MADPEDGKPKSERHANPDGVSHDQRGNAVWRWAADSGRHLVESATSVLRRLEVPGLKLEEDATGPHKSGGNAPGTTGAAKADTGYDPYGSKRAAAAPRRHPAAGAARPAATKPAAALPPRRSWWRRLFGRD